MKRKLRQTKRDVSPQPIGIDDEETREMQSTPVQISPSLKLILMQFVIVSRNITYLHLKLLRLAHCSIIWKMKIGKHKNA